MRDVSAANHQAGNSCAFLDYSQSHRRPPRFVFFVERVSSRCPSPTAPVRLAYEWLSFGCPKSIREWPAAELKRLFRNLKNLKLSVSLALSSGRKWRLMAEG